MSLFSSEDYPMDIYEGNLDDEYEEEEDDSCDWFEDHCEVELARAEERVDEYRGQP